MSWDLIIGQQRVKNLLQGSLERNHLAHAFLFYGPEGAGQDAVAIELAKILNCSAGSVSSCGQCADCLKSVQLQHPNIQLIFPLPVGKSEEAGDLPFAKLTPADLELVREEMQAKAKNPYHTITIPRATSVKVNSIREIRRSASMNVFSEGKKVFIVSNADKMNDEAANALLKTLEEPLEDTYIILTTSNADQLLPTIVSRCQRVRFDPLPEEEIRKALIDRFNMEPAKAELLVDISRGNFSIALELLDSDLTQYRDDVVDFLRTILYRTREDLFNRIQQIAAEGDRKEVERSLVLLQAWFHDAMTAKEGPVSRKHIQENTSLRKFIEIHPSIDYGKVHEALTEAVSSINKNVYIPLILIVLSLKLRAIILTRH